MLIRPLDPEADRALLSAFFGGVADYIRLERDTAPGPELLNEFFGDAPPGCDPAASARLGMFDAGRLLGIAEMGFGYPKPEDAYLGLMLLHPDARGGGRGAYLLRHLEDLARSRGRTRIALAVLEINPRGRAFWEREGFQLELANRQVVLGSVTRIAHRLVKPLSLP